MPELANLKWGRFEVQEDLKEFTGLPEDMVHRMLMRWDEGMRFTDEYHGTPEGLRYDQWYYLTSRFYVFANALHRYLPVCGLVEPEVFSKLMGSRSRVLDYAGGTGNASFATEALGYRTTFRELSSVQTEFVRFRAHKYGVKMDFHGWWERLPPASFDCVCFDSIGHVVNQKAELDHMSSALGPWGLLFLTLDFSEVYYKEKDVRRWQPDLPESLWARSQTMHVGPQLKVPDYLEHSLGFKKLEQLSDHIEVWVKGF